MKKFAIIFLMASLLFIPDSQAQKKLAQTGFQFLSVGIDARATAMGEAFTSIGGSSICLFYNPAGLAQMRSRINLSFSQMEWIADIKYNAGTFGLNLFDGKYGVLGVSFLTVDYGEFLWTKVAKTEAGFEDIEEGWPQPTAFMLGLGYAKELSDKFSVGGQIKMVTQDLGKSYVPVYTETDTIQEVRDYSKNVPAFDFGTIYRTGFKSLAFGMTIRNFSQEVKYEKEGFQLPLTFKIGIFLNAFDFLPSLEKYHKLNIAIDAVHPRSYPEFINIGGEYVFMDMIFLRAGYISNQDVYDFTAGIGFEYFGLALDYSYMPFSVFDNVNRFSVKFSF